MARKWYKYNYSMALLITTNTNEKYLLVVEKPAQ